MLQLPNLSMPFEVHTDASDYAIGGVLVQEGHPVAFESRKLNDVEKRYTVQEKEMTAVVHCLRTWRHYLLGSKFIVRYLFEPANKIRWLKAVIGQFPTVDRYWISP